MAQETAGGDVQGTGEQPGDSFEPTEYPSTGEGAQGGSSAAEADAPEPEPYPSAAEDAAPQPEGAADDPNLDSQPYHRVTGDGDFQEPPAAALDDPPQFADQDLPPADDPGFAAAQEQEQADGPLDTEEPPAASPGLSPGAQRSPAGKHLPARLAVGSPTAASAAEASPLPGAEQDFGVGDTQPEALAPGEDQPEWEAAGLPQQTPQGETAGLPPHDFEAEPEAEQDPEQDPEGLGQQQQPYEGQEEEGAGQPPYDDPEVQPYGEGAVEELQDPAGQPQYDPEGEQPPPPPPVEGEDGVEGTSFDPQRPFDPEAQDGPGGLGPDSYAHPGQEGDFGDEQAAAYGAVSPSAADAEVGEPQPQYDGSEPAPSYSFEVQPELDGDLPAGDTFITETRTKASRGIPQPPGVQVPEEPSGQAQDIEGDGRQPAEAGDFDPGLEEGQYSGQEALLDQVDRGDEAAAAADAEYDPGAAFAPEHEPFYEEGEAEVELQPEELQQQRGDRDGVRRAGVPQYDDTAAAATGSGMAGDGDGGYGRGGGDSALQSPIRGYSPGEGLEYDMTRTGEGAASPYGRSGISAGGGGGSGPRMGGGADGETAVELAMERERFSQQLQMEVRAREELEDMILRIEKHFKAEQAARKKAEELLQASIAAELEAKNHLEDLLKKRREEQRLLDEERAGIKRERNALEGMRQDFEAELQAARAEVAKAQDALAASEDRIRAAEAVDRARLESEYQSKINSLQEEIGRLRDELAYRTQMMASEMTRWQQQAHLTAAAVMEAKNEVLERKRELDCTKEKMDRLLDKLYIGRERNIELSGAIAAAQSYAQHAGAHGGMASMAGLMPPAMLSQNGGLPGGPGGARGAALLAALPQLPGGSPGGHSNIPKLPPLNPAGRPPLFSGPELTSPTGGPRRSAPGGQMSAYEGGGMFMPGMGPMGMAGAPGGFMMNPMAMGPMGPMGQMVPMGPMGFGGGGGDQYAHVQSRYAQPTEPAAGGKEAGGKKGRAANARGGKKPLDRFEESKRDEARLAAMAKRWG